MKLVCLLVLVGLVYSVPHPQQFHIRVSDLARVPLERSQNPVQLDAGLDDGLIVEPIPDEGNPKDEISEPFVDEEANFPSENEEPMNPETPLGEGDIYSDGSVVDIPVGGEDDTFDSSYPANRDPFVPSFMFGHRRPPRPSYDIFDMERRLFADMMNVHQEFTLLSRLFEDIFRPPPMFFQPDVPQVEEDAIPEEDAVVPFTESPSRPPASPFHWFISPFFVPPEVPTFQFSKFPAFDGLPDNYHNSTHHVADVNGTKYEVNQTVSKKTGDGFNSFFQIKTIQLYPGGPSVLVEEVPEEEQTTLSPPPVEEVFPEEDTSFNEIARGVAPSVVLAEANQPEDEEMHADTPMILMSRPAPLQMPKDSTWINEFEVLNTEKAPDLSADTRVNRIASSFSQGMTMVDRDAEVFDWNRVVEEALAAEQPL